MLEKPALKVLEVLGADVGFGMEFDNDTLAVAHRPSANCSAATRSEGSEHDRTMQDVVLLTKSVFAHRHL